MPEDVTPAAATETAPEAPPPLYVDDSDPGPPPELAQEMSEEAPEAAPAPEPEPEPEAAPDAPTDRALADLVRREAALLQKEKQLGGLTKAQQAIQSGNHMEAAKALGIDPNQMLREYWGDELLPAKEEPAPDAQIGSVKDQVTALQQELADTRAAMAKQGLYGQINKTMAKMASDGTPLEAMSMLVEQGGETVYDNLLEEAYRAQSETGEMPSWSDVLQKAESAYVERACSVAQNLLQLGVVRSRLGLDEPTTDQPEQATEPPVAPAKPQTITSKLTAEAPPRQAQRPMTREERRDEALRALKLAVKA